MAKYFRGSLNDRLDYHTDRTRQGKYIDGRWCKRWTGNFGNHGYGRSYDGVDREQLAHRLQFNRHYGYFPPVVQHKCDHKWCMEERHLEPGTLISNAIDRDGKDRVAHGETHYKSKLSQAQVRAIRKDPRSGAAIGVDYGMSRGVINRIRAGKHRTRD